MNQPRAANRPLDSPSPLGNGSAMPRLRTVIACVTLLLVAVASLILGGPRSDTDAGLLRLAQQGFLVPPARLLTRLGDWWLVLVAGATAALWLALKREGRAALALASLLVAERLAVEQLKLVFDRARPDPAGHLIAVHTLAFPSGHAANAMALGLGLALLWPMSQPARAWAIAAALLYAFSVGATRLVLGVHWPSDVVGGWAVGALLALLLAALARGTSSAAPH
jgi:membrane-associated phospholipid phosphatase